MKKKLYLAGPMRGIPYFNYPAFHKAAAALRAEGFYVFNPAENDEKHFSADNDNSAIGIDVAAGYASLDNAMRRVLLAEDMAFICREADAIALLPGWRDSKGARAEKATAEALGLGVIYLNADSNVVSFENLTATGLQGDLFDQVAGLYLDHANA